MAFPFAVEGIDKEGEKCREEERRCRVTDSSPDLAEWEEQARQGPGRARMYVNECFKERVRVNSKVLAGLVAGQEFERETREWDVANALLGPRGLRPVLAVAAAWPHLVVLDLSGNGLDSASVADTLFTSTIGKHPSLTSLNLEHNDLHAGAVPALLQVLTPRRNGTGLKALHLDGNPGIPAAKLAAIRRKVASVAGKLRPPPPVPPPPPPQPPKDEPFLEEVARCAGESVAEVFENDGWGRWVDSLVASGGAAPVLPLGYMKVPRKEAVAQVSAHLQQVDAVLLDESIAAFAEEEDSDRAAGLYGHIRAKTASAVKASGGDAAVAAEQLLDAVASWLEADAKTGRRLPHLVQEVKYHLIARGRRAAEVVNRWLSGRGAHGCFRSTLQPAAGGSPHPEGRDPGARRVLCTAVAALLPPPLLLWLLQACFLPSPSPAAEDLPSDLLPSSSDPLVRLYDWHEPRAFQSPLAKLADFHSWLCLQPLQRLIYMKEAFPG